MSSSRLLHRALLQIDQFLSPPQLSQNKQERQTRQLRLLVTLYLLLVFAYAVLVLLFSPDEIARLRNIPLWLSAIVLPVILLRLKHHRAAIDAFLIGGWLLITLITATIGGTRASAFGFYAVVVALAALWVGWQSALGYMVVSIAAGGVMVYLDSINLLPELHSTASIALLTESITIVLLTVTIYLLVRQSERALIHAQQELAERRQAEQALRDSEKRYRMLGEIISDYAYSYDVAPDGTYTAGWITGDSFTRMTGYQWSEIGSSYILYHPDDVPVVREHVVATLKGQATSGDYRILTKSGELRWVHIKRQVELEGERVIRFYGAATDITERKMADQALRESEAKFRSFFEIAPSGIAIVNNATGCYVDANPAFLQAINLPREAVVGHTVDEMGLILGSMEFRERIREKFRQSGKLDNEEVALIYPDGRMGVCLYSLRATEIGGEPHLLTTALDITDRKNVESEVLGLNDELQQRASYLRTLNHIAREVTTLMDMDTTLRNIMTQLASIVSFDMFYVSLVDQETRVIRFPIMYDAGQYWSQPDSLLDRSALISDVLTSGQPTLVNRTPEQIQAFIDSSSLIGDTSRVSASLIVVPLPLRDRVTGVMSIQSYTMNAYQHKHVDLLMGAAYSVSIAIDNAHLYDSLQHELEQRRQAEEATRRSEARLRALLDATTDVAFLMDKDGTFLTLNRTLATTIGGEVEDFIGQNGFDLLQPELRAVRNIHFEQVVKTMQPERWVDQAGTSWWDNNLFPVISSQGTVEAFALYSRNITEQKFLETELKRYTAQLEQMVEERTAQLMHTKAQIEIILNNISDAIALAKPNGDILTRNPAFVTMFGNQVSNCIEHLLWVMPEDTHGEATGSALLDVMWHRAPQRVEVQIADEQGGTKDIDLALIPVQLDDPGDRPGILVSAHDITHLKEIERFKARFIADAVHDLATPITGLTTRLYLLKRTPEKLDDHVRAIGNQVDHLRNLLSDLRTLSLIDRKRLTLDLHTCDLNQVALRVFDTYEPVAISKNQTLKLVTDPALPPLMLDNGQIERVLVNLVSNAINYTPPGKDIVIQTACSDDSVVLVVEDEGMGIGAEELPHVFDRFYRTNSARHAQAGGTGLGLAIAKEIVELHGGRVTVKSEVGVGSTFVVHLPTEN
jgi:PAS domain S-box-containing protein